MRRHAETVDAARGGDPQAWRSLYDAHAGRLLAWLGTLPHRDFSASAEDLAAEAWLTAAARIGDYTGDDAGFGGWLFTIARHHAHNSGRKAARRATDPVAEVDTTTTDGDDVAGLVVGADYVRSLLALLPERDAEVVAAREVAGLTVAETAAALDLSATHVRVIHHRALGKLRRHLGEGGSPAPLRSQPA